MRGYMQEKECPNCGGNARQIVGVPQNEFITFRCDDCRHTFKLPPEPELTATPDYTPSFKP